VGAPTLSILICHISSRESLLNRLLSILEPQLTDQVEVLIETDNGERTTGEKRNVLLDKAQGEYVAFIDDDDTVSFDYVAKILKAVETKPDCCSLQGELRRSNNPSRFFFHSIQWDHWFERNGRYYRNPNHLNAVKREIAVNVRFPKKNVGEDQDYSMRLHKHLVTEVPILGTIYIYHKDN